MTMTMRRWASGTHVLDVERLTHRLSPRSTAETGGLGDFFAVENFLWWVILRTTRACSPYRLLVITPFWGLNGEWGWMG